MFYFTCDRFFSNATGELTNLEQWKYTPADWQAVSDVPLSTESRDA